MELDFWKVWRRGGNEEVMSGVGGRSVEEIVRVW